LSHYLRNAFIGQFRSFFGDAHTQRNAQVTLSRLTQGRGPTSSYASRFRRIAVDTGFNEMTLMESKLLC
jgi:hypothetical protein